MIKKLLGLFKKKEVKVILQRSTEEQAAIDEVMWEAFFPGTPNPYEDMRKKVDTYSEMNF